MVLLTISPSFGSFIPYELGREVLVEDVKAVSDHWAAMVKVILACLINSKILSESSTTVCFFDLSYY